MKSMAGAMRMPDRFSRCQNAANARCYQCDEGLAVSRFSDTGK